MKLFEKEKVSSHSIEKEHHTDGGHVPGCAAGVSPGHTALLPRCCRPCDRWMGRRRGS